MKETKERNDVSLLDADVRELLCRALEKIQYHKLPFFVKETKRSRQRHRELYESGLTPFETSPLENGRGFVMALYDFEKDKFLPDSRDNAYLYNMLGALLTSKELGFKWGKYFKCDGKPHREYGVFFKE